MEDCCIFSRETLVLLTVYKIVGLGRFTFSGRLLFRPFPIVSANIIVAGNFRGGKSPLSLSMSSANSIGTLIMRLADADFSLFNAYLLNIYKSTAEF